MTALPNLRPVTMPTRVEVAGSQFRMRQPQAMRFPCVRARAKSRAALIRARRAKNDEAAGWPFIARRITPASNACARHDAGSPESLDHFCWSCVQESRAAVSGGFLTVDIDVSSYCILFNFCFCAGEKTKRR